MTERIDRILSVMSPVCDHLMEDVTDPLQQDVTLARCRMCQQVWEIEDELDLSDFVGAMH